MSDSSEWYLQEWGRYIKFNKYENLGYPRKAPFIDGPGVIRSTAPIENMPEHIEKSNNIITQGNFSKDHVLSLHYKYVHGLSARKVEQLYDFSRSRFLRLVKDAESKFETLLKDGSYDVG